MGIIDWRKHERRVPMPTGEAPAAGLPERDGPERELPPGHPARPDAYAEREDGDGADSPHRNGLDWCSRKRKEMGSGGYTAQGTPRELVRTYHEDELAGRPFMKDYPNGDTGTGTVIGVSDRSLKVRWDRSGNERWLHADEGTVYVA